MAVPPYMQSRILDRYIQEASMRRGDSAEDKISEEAQERLQAQEQSMQFSDYVDQQRANWITFCFRKIANFDHMPRTPAEEIVDSVLIPACNEKEVELKGLQIEKIKRAFAYFQKFTESNNQYISFEKLNSPSNISKNDSIAALLLQGYDARYNRGSAAWEFKAKVT